MTQVFYTFICFLMYSASFAQVRPTTNPIPKPIAPPNLVPTGSKPINPPTEKERSQSHYLMNKFDEEEKRKEQLWNQLNTNNQPTISSLNSLYPILELNPINESTDTIQLNSIGEIKLMDLRSDKLKIGFLPVQYELAKKGYTTLGLQFDKSLNKWVKENFIEKNIATDTNSSRKLIILMQKFWFSNSVKERFNGRNPKLETTLYYDFDLFTHTEKGYYAQKKIMGSITTLFNKGNAYSQLTDSILQVLKQGLVTTHFLDKENNSNWLSPIDFNDYCNRKIIKTAQISKSPKGLYATYEDFLEKKILCDSVDMVIKYTNYDHSAPLYACNVIGYQEGKYVSTNKSWGFFDGHAIFLNTGEGFFIKLTPSKEGYIFLHLKNIGEDKIKKYMLDGIQIGDNQYQILKNYTAAFSFTFQLDLDNGKLY